MILVVATVGTHCLLWFWHPVESRKGEIFHTWCILVRTYWFIVFSSWNLCVLKRGAQINSRWPRVRCCGCSSLPQPKLLSNKQTKLQNLYDACPGGKAFWEDNPFGTKCLTLNPWTIPLTYSLRTLLRVDPPPQTTWSDGPWRCPAGPLIWNEFCAVPWILHLEGVKSSLFLQQ